MMNNCPNCGAPLVQNRCEYCGAIIRRPNTVDVFENGECEITLQMKHGNEIYILPLVGHIGSITRSFNTIDITSYNDECIKRICGPDSIEFNFEGYIREDIND